MSQEIINEGQVWGTYIVYEILKKLIAPFKETQAYKLGIIDQRGKVLRPRHSLKTQEEKNSYTILDTMIFNIKKMIEKLPGGKSRLASFAAALWLIREAKNHEFYVENENEIETDLTSFINTIQINEDVKQQINNLFEKDIKFDPKLKLEKIELSANFELFWEK
jgi:maltooligosyltrehalose synthase